MNFKKIQIGIISLGCPKNTADTEYILSLLPSDCVLTNVENAEIVIINTCAFLKTARDEAFENLKNLKNKKIIILGCLVSQLKKAILKKYPQLYAVANSENYTKIPKIINEIKNGRKVFTVSKPKNRYIETSGKIQITPKSYAYIKIAEGCNNSCSFCLIPKLKGSYCSRPMENVLKEAKTLVGSGVKELILVAQDIGYYGMDLYDKKSLSTLLKKLTEIPGNFQIRLLYIYPERINQDLLNIMANSTKICKYLDIPLQHGDSEILKLMRRPFSTEATLKKIEQIRKTIPKMTFRTSLIVGFPGETEKHFKNLIKFVKKINFNHIGVFPYSREKGTLSYSMKNQIPLKTKLARKKKIMLLQQKISYALNRLNIGKTIKVLIDGHSMAYDNSIPKARLHAQELNASAQREREQDEQSGFAGCEPKRAYKIDKYDKQRKIYIGRSEQFCPEIDGEILIKSNKPLIFAEFYNIKILHATPYDLIGVITNPKKG